jgi:hypothetical protein
MITTLRRFLAALVLGGLAAGCLTSSPPTPQQHAEIDTCVRSGGMWSSGTCEQASSGGGY